MRFSRQVTNALESSGYDLFYFSIFECTCEESDCRRYAMSLLGEYESSVVSLVTCDGRNIVVRIYSSSLFWLIPRD
jgi:hypothetical protein